MLGARSSISGAAIWVASETALYRMNIQYRIILNTHFPHWGVGWGGEPELVIKIELPASGSQMPWRPNQVKTIAQPI